MGLLAEEILSRQADGDVPMMVLHWREQPLSRRFDQAARDYTMSHEHPALSGMAESMRMTAWRYGVEEEALKEYIEVLRGSRIAPEGPEEDSEGSSTPQTLEANLVAERKWWRSILSYCARPFVQVGEWIDSIMPTSSYQVFLEEREQIIKIIRDQEELSKALAMEREVMEVRFALILDQIKERAR
jgi:hypothetical protein